MNLRGGDMNLTKLRNRSGGRRRTSPLAGTKALPGRSRVKLAEPVLKGVSHLGGGCPAMCVQRSPSPCLTASWLNQIGWRPAGGGVRAMGEAQLHEYLRGSRERQAVPDQGVDRRGLQRLCVQAPAHTHLTR